MTHSVRATLIALGVGSLLQRLGQLVAVLWLCHALGPAGAGAWAQGVALGSLLAALAGTGLRSQIARAIAQRPTDAGAWLRAAVRGRLVAGALLTAVATAIALAVAAHPWFWVLCALQTIPAAFDLKNLADATRRTRAEVAIETCAGAGFLIAVVAATLLGCREPAVYIGCHLLSRCLYAAAATSVIAQMPRAGEVPTAWELLRAGTRVSLAQTTCESVGAADVWLVALLGGDAAAGLFALAQRLTAAASLPSQQLTRLLLPHLFTAAAAGEPGRTLLTALRATALTTLPVAAGGAVAAEAACSVFGAAFAPAALPLRLLLVATVLQHLGWQCSHAQLAAGRDREYAHGLACQAVALVLGMALAVPDLGATGAGLAALAAQAGYLALVLASASRHGRVPPARWLGAAAGVAAATALATLTVGEPTHPPSWRLIAQGCAGGGAWLLGIWVVELRRRSAALGDGLVRASGFRG